MLTDLKVRSAKPRSKDYKLADSGGLYLYVTTKGYRSWRMKYRFGGREKRLTFGPYPEVSLTLRATSATPPSATSATIAILRPKN